MSESAPKNGEFSDGKFWFQRKGSSLTLGMTSLAIEEIGQVQSIDFPDEEEDFTKGDVIVTVEGTNGSLELVTPATGVITEINSAAKDEPDVVSEDPLEEGWLIKLTIEDTSDLREFA